MSSSGGPPSSRPAHPYGARRPSGRRRSAPGRPAVSGGAASVGGRSLAGMPHAPGSYRGGRNVVAGGLGYEDGISALGGGGFDGVASLPPSRSAPLAPPPPARGSSRHLVHGGGGGGGEGGGMAMMGGDISVAYSAPVVMRKQYSPPPLRRPAPPPPPPAAVPPGGGGGPAAAPRGGGGGRPGLGPGEGSAISAARRTRQPRRGRGDDGDETKTMEVIDEDRSFRFGSNRSSLASGARTASQSSMPSSAGGERAEARRGSGSHKKKRKKREEAAKRSKSGSSLASSFSFTPWRSLRGSKQAAGAKGYADRRPPSASRLDEPGGTLLKTSSLSSGMTLAPPDWPSWCPSPASCVRITAFALCLAASAAVALTCGQGRMGRGWSVWASRHFLGGGAVEGAPARLRPPPAERAPGSGEESGAGGRIPAADREKALPTATPGGGAPTNGGTNIPGAVVPSTHNLPNFPDLASMNIDLGPELTRNYADTWDAFPPVGSRKEAAVFWQVPRSGGNVIKAALGQCLGLVEGSELGALRGNEGSLKTYETIQGARFVNVDTTTASGIRRGVALGLASSGLVDVAFTPLLRHAASLFDPLHRGRVLAVFRHPVDRAVSEYHRDVKTRPDEFEDVPLLEYARGGHVRGDWMTRVLVGKELTPAMAAGTAPPPPPLTDDDLHLALEILRRKVLVGLADRMEESLGRFERRFGWDRILGAGPEAGRCRGSLLAKVQAPGANPSAEEGGEAWRLLAAANRNDMRLYEYARYLYSVQGTKIS